MAPGTAALPRVLPTPQGIWPIRPPADVTERWPWFTPDGPTEPMPELLYEGLKTCTAHALGAINSAARDAASPARPSRPANGVRPGRASTSSTTAARPSTPTEGASHGRN